MIKKLIGFLTVLCMAFFIAGCSSTPDLSGTYLRLNSNNEPVGAIVVKSINDKTYDCSQFSYHDEKNKMIKIKNVRRVLNVEKKSLEIDNLDDTALFFDKDYNTITRTARSISGANKEYTYKKLSDSEMKQYQHLFE
ncbi:hypothetical protein [Negativicoccus succinicivorans]|uniref:hypothetical protein n=1 Tax=Negativicoccus succinicivorans TaxID=620903 RepID=UPI00290C72C2|nr:hypothetical protein [Negativicoccus succinicivorans]MDU5530081.1 hypothetical protein [Negativicoccus succinicivorans]